MGEDNLNAVFLMTSGLLEEGKNGESWRNTFRVGTACFVFVTQGSVDITLNLDEHRAEKNDLLTVFQGSIVQIDGWSDDLRAYCINFPKEFTRDLDLWKSAMGSINAILDNPVLRLKDSGSILFLKSYCSMLYEISAGDLTFRQEIVKSMLEGVMFAVSGFYRDISRSDAEPKRQDLFSRRHDITRRFVDLASRYYDTHRDISYYADLLCITPKHLGYAVRSASGRLASDVISRMVIMDAKSKLKNSGLSVSQIADSLNFPNPSFFCKYFRKHTGMTPKQFRDSEISVAAAC